MLLLPLLAALGAALTQAAAAFIAHGAARQLGAVEFTRVQLTASALVLAVVVTATHGWSGLVATHMLAIGVSSIVGVVLTNLTMSECLRRSGPRRTQLLLTLRTPITAILAFAFLGEVLSLRLLLATSLILLGVMLAVIHGRGSMSDHPLESVNGSLSVVVLLGLASATCQAIGLIAIKPVMIEGLPALTASAMRTMGGAWVLTTLTIVPMKHFAPPVAPTGRNVAHAIVPGLLGYVLATTLLFYAVQNGSAVVAIGIFSTVPVLSLPMLWVVTKKRPPLPAWGGAVLVVIGAAIIA